MRDSVRLAIEIHLTPPSSIIQMDVVAGYKVAIHGYLYAWDAILVRARTSLSSWNLVGLDKDD